MIYIISLTSVENLLIVPANISHGDFGGGFISASNIKLFY